MYKNKINYKLLNFLILMGLLYICVTNIGTWFQIISKVVSVCFPFIIAFAIAYALYPLEKNWKKGVRKSIAITFLVIISLLIIFGLIAITLPLVYQQLISFASSFGTVVDEVSRKFNLNLSSFENTLSTSLNQIIGSLGNILQKGTIDVVGKTVSILGQSVIVLVVTIYFLAYMDKIRGAVKRFLKSLENRSYAYVKALDIEISNYLKGLGLFMVIQFLNTLSSSLLQDTLTGYYLVF